MEMEMETEMGTETKIVTRVEASGWCLDPAAKEAQARDHARLMGEGWSLASFETGAKRPAFPVSRGEEIEWIAVWLLAPEAAQAIEAAWAAAGPELASLRESVRRRRAIARDHEMYGRVAVPAWEAYCDARAILTSFEQTLPRRKPNAYFC